MLQVPTFQRVQLTHHLPHPPIRAVDLRSLFTSLLSLPLVQLTHYDWRDRRFGSDGNVAHSNSSNSSGCSSQSDFFLLPCNLISTFSLQTLANLFRVHQPAIISLFYDATPAISASSSSSASPEEKQYLSGWEPKCVAIESTTHFARMIGAPRVLDELEGGYKLHKSMLRRHQNLTILTSLLDPHIYVISHWVLDLLDFAHSVASGESSTATMQQSDESPLLADDSKTKSLESQLIEPMTSVTLDLVPFLIRNQCNPAMSKWRRTDGSASALSFSHAPQSMTPVVFAPIDDANGSFNLTASSSLASTTTSGTVSAIPAAQPISAIVHQSFPMHENFRCLLALAPSTVYCRRIESCTSYLAVNREIASDREIPGQSWPPLSVDNQSDNVSVAFPKAQLGGAGTHMASDCKLGDATSVKRCIIGKNVRVGAQCKLSGCVILQSAQIDDQCKLDDCVIGVGATIGKGCTLKDCRIAPGVAIPAGTEGKNDVFS